jgi:hypothetical protein
MYLVLKPQIDALGNKRNDYYSPVYTDDIEVAHEHMNEGCMAYKLDSLTRVTSIDVTYKEVL